MRANEIEFETWKMIYLILVTAVMKTFLLNSIIFTHTEFLYCLKARAFVCQFIKDMTSAEEGENLIKFSEVKQGL